MEHRPVVDKQYVKAPAGTADYLVEHLGLGVDAVVVCDVGAQDAVVIV